MKNKGYSYPDRASSADEGLTVLAFYPSRYPHSTEAEWRLKIEAGAGPAERPSGGARRPPDAGRRARLLIAGLGKSPTLRRISRPCSRTSDVLVLAKPSGLPVLPGGFFLENDPASSRPRALRRGLFAAPSAGPRHVGGHPVHPQPPRPREPGHGHVRAANPQGLPGPGLGNRDAGRVHGRRADRAGSAYASRRPSTPIAPTAGRRRATFASSAGSRNGTLTLVEVTIPTGRPHQIRIHLAYAGFPLVGDPLYRAGRIPARGRRRR